MNKLVFCIVANFLFVLEGLQAFVVIDIIHNMPFRLKSIAKPELATENDAKNDFINYPWNQSMLSRYSQTVQLIINYVIHNWYLNNVTVCTLEGEL